jgi:hypothetical protein
MFFYINERQSFCPVSKKEHEKKPRDVSQEQWGQRFSKEDGGATVRWKNP